MTGAVGHPVATWPTEAVQAALERGDLEHWQRLTAELMRDPWGRTARQVEEVLTHSRPYGVADLMETVISRARAKVELEERRAVAAQVRLRMRSVHPDHGGSRADAAKAMHYLAAARQILTEAVPK